MGLELFLLPLYLECLLFRFLLFLDPPKLRLVREWRRLRLRILAAKAAGEENVTFPSLSSSCSSFSSCDAGGTSVVSATAAAAGGFFRRNHGQKRQARHLGFASASSPGTACRASGAVVTALVEGLMISASSPGGSSLFFVQFSRSRRKAGPLPDADDALRARIEKNRINSHLINHCPTSSGVSEVSERTSEHSGASEQSE